MNCKNCGHPLNEGAHFCENCGAKVIQEPFTFKYVSRDFEEKYLDLDRNLLWSTFRDMTIRPQQVINGYINGIRKRYLNLASWLAVAITISGLLVFVITDYFPESVDMSWMFDPNDPAFKDNPFVQNMNQEGATQDLWWMEFQSVFYLLFIPIYAMLSKLTFWNQKDYSYLKHIVIVSYSQGYASIASALPILILLMLGYNYMKMSPWILLFMFLYSAYVYKKVFNLSFLQIVGRSLLFLLIALGVYIVFVIIMLIAVLGF